MKKLAALASLATLAGAASAQNILTLEFADQPLADYNLTPLGNGTSEANGNQSTFVDGGNGNVYIQSFLNATNAALDPGVAVIPTSGVTLNAGTEYTFTVDALQFYQGWDAGLNFEVALSSSMLTGPNDPVDVSAFFTLTEDNNGNYGPIERFSFTFTPTQTLTDPFIVLRTDESELQSTGAQSRILFDALYISEGTPVTVLDPDLNIDGNVDFFDVLALLDGIDAAS
ncbi:MAG: hypothetical protein AAF747_00285 [Planctomycetota bacterium]